MLARMYIAQAGGFFVLLGVECLCYPSTGETRKVVLFAPEATDNERSFLASRIATLAWNMGANSKAVLNEL